MFFPLSNTPFNQQFFSCFIFSFCRHSRFASTPNPRQITTQNTVCVDIYINFQLPFKILCMYIYIWNESCKFGSSFVTTFSISSEKEIPFTWSELLRWRESKSGFLVGLLTFVSSNHPSVFQGFTGEALHSFPSVAALWLHWKKEYTRTWKRLQSQTPKRQNTSHIHAAISSVSHCMSPASFRYLKGKGN